MQDIFNLLFILIVASGSYSAAVIVNGKRVCSKCDLDQNHQSRNHIPTR